MRKKPEPYEHHVELFDRDVILLCGWKDEEAVAWLRKRLKDPDLKIVPESQAQCSRRAAGIAILLRSRWEDSPHNLETLAHETLHAVNGILWDARLKHTRETEEVWSYLIGYLMKKFLFYLRVEFPTKPSRRKA